MEKININHYILDFAKKNILLFIIFIILLGVYPVQKIYLPKLYGKSISVISNKNKFIQSLKILLFVYIIIQFLYSINYIVQGYLIPNFSEYATLEIFKSVIKSYNYDYENVETGKILAKLIKIQNVLFAYLDSIRTFLFSQLLIFSGAFIQYYNISKKLSYYFVLIVLFIVLLQYFTFKYSLKYDIDREFNKDKIYAHCEDVFNNLISVFICKQQSKENQLLINRFKPYTNAFIKSNKISFIFRILFAFLNIFIFTFINYQLIKLFVNKKISKEVFISSFIITFSLLSVMSEIYYGTKKFMENYAQVKDLEDYFNNKIKEQSNLSSQKNNYNFINGVIEFQNVFYNYQLSFSEKDSKNNYLLEKDSKNNYLLEKNNKKINKFALINVSLKINKGEKVAFVGSIGSGKSTCAKLLLKLLPSSIGKISINNVDINDISMISLRNNIFYIPQNPKLLNRSLYENITYGLLENYNYENRIFSVLNSFNIKELNVVFKEKMHSDVGVNGNKLSGGQRQIVWLLRAFLRNSEVIILDEPTASLDPKSKKIVFDFVKFIGKNKTIIVITHDNIDNEFRKIYFNDGKIYQP